MSIDALSWAWKQELKTPTNMIVLLHLADSANDLDGLTYYALNHIGRRCCCSRSTVIRQLKWLVEEAYITLVREAEYGKAGNVYRVNYHLSAESRIELAKEQAKTIAPDDDSSDDNDGGGQADTLDTYPQPVSESNSTGNKDSVNVTPPGVTEESVGVTEESVGVSESDLNPNLLNQKNLTKQERAQGSPVDNSKQRTVDSRITAVCDFFQVRGCSAEQLEMPNARMLVRTWLAHGLTTGQLEKALTDVLPDEIAAMKCKDPIRTVNAVLYEKLTGRHYDVAEEQALVLRATPKSVNESDRAKLLKAAGVRPRQVETA